MRFLILLACILVLTLDASMVDKSALAQFLGQATQAEPLAVGNVNDGAVARFGKAVGAATACPKIDRHRIGTMTETVLKLLKSMAQTPEELALTKKIFDTNLDEGQQAIAGRRIDCASAERDFAEFEQTFGIFRSVAGQQVPTTRSAVWGVTDNEILFGMSAPFSGPSRELGQSLKVGIETAFSQANSKGGVNGRKLRLLVADDGYEPTRTTETMKDLYENKHVFGFIGNVGTPTAVVAVPYALERRVLFYGAFSGANLLRRDPPDRYVFNLRASYAEETEAVVRYLIKLKHLKPEQIAVFAQQDAFGDSGFDGVTKAIRTLRGGDSGTILRLGYKRNTIDIDDAIKRLGQSHIPIKAVVMVATYRAAAAFISRTRDTNPEMIYTNVSFVGSTALADELKLLGLRFAVGVIVTQVVPAVDSYSNVALEYKAALAAFAPGESANYVSFEGYLSAKVLIEALQRAGPQVDAEKVINMLEGLRDFDIGLGTLINFNATEHQGLHKVWGTQLDRDGRYQVLELQ